MLFKAKAAGGGMVVVHHCGEHGVPGVRDGERDGERYGKRGHVVLCWLLLHVLLRLLFRLLLLLCAPLSVSYSLHPSSSLKDTDAREAGLVEFVNVVRDGEEGMQGTR